MRGECKDGVENIFFAVFETFLSADFEVILGIRGDTVRCGPLRHSCFEGSNTWRRHRLILRLGRVLIGKLRMNALACNSSSRP
jgi:hypothetical protein